MMNTLRSTLGYLATLITRYTPFDLSGDSLEGIFNFLRIRDSILTSGQPTERQFRLVRDAGVKRVINLAPHDAENALADEGLTLNALGMEYIHIPVDFRNPTEEDFKKFCTEMDQLGDEAVLVHCAANMRVSAFIFRYRRDVLGEDPETLVADLDAIWRISDISWPFLPPVSTSMSTKPKLQAICPDPDQPRRVHDEAGQRLVLDQLEVVVLEGVPADRDGDLVAAPRPPAAAVDGHGGGLLARIIHDA